MGIEKNVGFDVFPKQGEHLGKRAEVCFNYDTSRTLSGKIVRDDMEEPFRTIIELENGKYIMATECQYSVRD
jgi:hypothetical protein